ncbi:MAG TPA: hypothetical protein VH500_24040 [Nitrososphaeraceae archaeon]
MNEPVGISQSDLSRLNLLYGLTLVRKGPGFISTYGQSDWNFSGTTLIQV